MNSPARFPLRLLRLWAAILFSASISFGAVTEQRLKSFGFSNRTGSYPESALVIGSDGLLYGTTTSGGNQNAGAIFRVSPSGTGYAAIYVFPGNGNNGASPVCGLVEGPDGKLYGTTPGGGVNGAGTVFRVNTDGSGYAVLYEFGDGLLDGRAPRSSVMFGHDGNLYGTTSLGGLASSGTIFRIGADGSGYTILLNFLIDGLGGLEPEGGLIQDSSGTIYGTTYGGGLFNVGTVFKVDADGGGFTLLYTFRSSGGDGRGPEAGLTLGRDGYLYGTTLLGGSHGQGTAFKLHTDGSGYSVLYSFGATTTDGGFPSAALLQGSDGVLYGTTQIGGSNDTAAGGDGIVFKLNTNGTGYTVLHHLGATGSDGHFPYAALAQASDGTLYTTTDRGGTAALGSILKIKPNGSSYAVVWNFTESGGDGRQPGAGLAEGNDGALYGTTTSGGAHDFGTVFKLEGDGSGYVTLFDFPGGANGSDPTGTLVQGVDGSLYGTTLGGGSGGVGTIFRIGSDGSGFTVLHSFALDGVDGLLPHAGLTQGSDGALYGTTFIGGTSGQGSIFKLNTNGSGYAVLRNLGTSSSDPANPASALVQARDGALYGTAQTGGNGVGAVFKIATNGSGYTVLYKFKSSGGDAAGPCADLLQGADGFLYGTTQNGGGNNMGAVYKISTNGTGYAVLHSFTSGSSDGHNAMAALSLGWDGMIYGTTQNGGVNNVGVVFSLGTNGSGYSVLYNFHTNSGDGQRPASGLWRGSFGLTRDGGDAAFGTVFRLNSPPALLSGPQDLSVPSGANITFTVTASGLPVPLLQWRFNSTNLIDSARISGSDTATLHITNVQGSDVGSYTVILSNENGAVTSSVAHLTLATLLPQILTQPAPQIVPFGATAAFDVTVSGPSPHFQWNFEGTKFPGATSSTLTIPNITSTDAGVYDIVITNSYGSVTSAPASLTAFGMALPTGAITVTGPPGGKLRIDYTDFLPGGTNWQVLTNLTITNPAPQQITDPQFHGRQERFYRAVLLP